jgi:hypothetical protein
MEVWLNIKTSLLRDYNRHRFPTLTRQSHKDIIVLGKQERTLAISLSHGWSEMKTVARQLSQTLKDRFIGVRQFHQEIGYAPHAFCVWCKWSTPNTQHRFCSYGCGPLLEYEYRLLEGL